jgi:mono/diheme cytochrome c family protein
MRSTLIPIAIIFIFAAQLPSQQPAASVDYAKQVQPIFNTCTACHKGSAAPAGLHLDTAAGALAGSNAGRVIIPGNSKGSLLVQRVSDTTGNQMPPSDMLSKEQIKIITDWVDQGAKPDASGTPEPAVAARVFPPAVSTIASATMEKNYFAAYCVTCHSGPYAKAGLELDKLDTAHVEKDAEKWEKVVRMLRSGMMPKAGMPRPDQKTFEAMTVWMETELDKHKVAQMPPPGLHRLNRAEYANAVRDLLAIEVDPSKFLPSDDSNSGFDNVAGGLSLSPALLEGYTSAAGKISRLAVGDVTTPVETTFRIPEDASEDYHIEGMPFGTRGGMIVKYEFPADGDYAIKITPISKGNMGNTNPFGEIRGEKLEFLLDGERLKLFDWDTGRAPLPVPGAAAAGARGGRGGGGGGGDGTFNFAFKATAGLHTVVVTFLATNYAPGNDLDEHFLRSTIETGGLPGYNFFPHVGKIRIDGPLTVTGVSDTESRRKIFACKPASAAEETACAKKIVAALARHAYRRPATDQDTETLMGFYQQGRNEGGNFDHGIEMAVRRVLMDPEFYFRKETEPANVTAGKAYRITDIELASRLSFFLWSSIPDEELLGLATQNKLHDPAVLEQQVKRMLADKRSDQLVVNFAGQWLSLRALPTQTPVTATFPDFDDNVRQAMRKETEMFVDSIVHEDRNVTDLLTANYTFLNERLAKHYGIPNIYGSNFRRVELTPEFDMRRGLLGKGSLMTISAKPSGTMPPIRGKTVMQIFLGVEPPPPPPNVPPLPPQEGILHGGAKPTMRQQMELHRANEPCSTCHKIMDPIGLSLENFDAVGAWRTDDDGAPIDAQGVLVDGTKLDGVAGLRAALVKYSPQFVRVITEKLMIYGLGRGTEYYDMPLVRSIVHDAEKNNYKFSALVLGVVKSEPFQMNQKLLSEGAQENKQRAAR